MNAVRKLMMGNEAISRGALEAGVSVAAAYPGTPSSEIIETLAKVQDEHNLYVEWSTNEKVSMEVAAAGSFAGLRSLCALKQNGLNVASDFLIHLAGAGTRGGFVVIPCDDPGALSSISEADSRYFAKMLEIPLLEPGTFQQAKDMTKWAFELSETVKNVVMIRSVTRLSHASGNVMLGEIPEKEATARFDFHGPALDPNTGVVASFPVSIKHKEQQEKMERVAEIFEDSPFNYYTGPENPELLIIASSSGFLYSREAVATLGLDDRVGVLNLATVWPFPARLVEQHVKMADKILVVEEISPFMEENLMAQLQQRTEELGVKKVFGRLDGSIPKMGELNPDIVMNTLKEVLDVNYIRVPDSYQELLKALVPALGKKNERGVTFCPGCPHRASFWSIHRALKLDGHDGFVCGDVGCYALDMQKTGQQTIKSVLGMGSGMGMASGFGKLKKFGMQQPVLSVCGDSTFFHSIMPSLVNAVHHQSDVLLVVLDNSGTAMTGFQPHPGTESGAGGSDAVSIDIESVCRAAGAKVKVRNPFDFSSTEEALLDFIEEKKGVRVLILKQPCVFSRYRREQKKHKMVVDKQVCLGESCGCNRLCTDFFQCPGLYWDQEEKVAKIDEALCAGCGVCSSVCTRGAIKKQLNKQEA